jgi:hypothetical protein
MTVLAAETQANAFARQRAGYEYGLAVDAGHATTVVGQIDDIGIHYSHAVRVSNASRQES